MRRIVRRVLLVSLVPLVILAGILGWQVYTIYSGLHEMTGVVVPRPTTEPTVTIPPLDSNKRINFLVLGSDNDRKTEEASPLTQSMIVVTVDPQDHRVGILSIPRDFWVPIRGHHMAKIDLAAKYGGIQLARETVERTFHIPIHYYAWIGLAGFIKVIDTFGGITIDINHPILDDTYPDDLNKANPYGYRRIFIPAGWQHFSGFRALEYVRSRHGDKIGDFGRSARQQQILVALQKKINAMNVLLHLPELVDDLKCCVRTDLNLLQLRQLEQLSHQIKRQDINRVVLQAPTYSTYAFSADGQSILRPNWPRINGLVRQMFAPIPPAAPTPVPATPTARPALTLTAGPTPSPTPVRTPTATPVPTATPAPLSGVPGWLVFVQNGNADELGPDGNVRQLTTSGDVEMPALSPNGRYLAYLRFSRTASDLWVTDLYNHRSWPLTHDRNPLHVRVPDVRNDLWAGYPSWSQEGSRVIFSWDRSKLSQAPSDVRPVDLSLWSVPFRGGAPVELTPPATGIGGAGGDTEPTPRPRSTQILYVRWTYTQSTNQPYSQLVLLDPRTGKSVPLTGIGGRVFQPSWDSSGRELVYVQTVNNVDQIVRARLNLSGHGPALVPLATLGSGEVAQPAFTPNGRSVTYIRADGDTSHLVAVPAGGGNATDVAGVPENIAWESHPHWAG